MNSSQILTSTSMMLMDWLSIRQKKAEEFNRRFGLNIEYHLIDDWENVNNIEAQAQDGLIGGADDGQPADLD